MRSSTVVLGGLLATVLAIALTPAAPRTQSLIGPLALVATDERELGRTIDAIGRMQRNGSLRLVEVAADPLAPTRTHQRFVQLHRSVRVLGGGVSVQSERGFPVSVFGHVPISRSIPSRSCRSRISSRWPTSQGALCCQRRSSRCSWTPRMSTGSCITSARSE